MTDRAGHRPLVAFTTLAIAGAGLAAASALFALAHGLVLVPALASGSVLLTAGLAVSLGHLGRKRRAGLAVRGAGRSALSNEAVLAGLALVAAAAAGGLGAGGAQARVVTAVAGALNAAFLVSVGLVYRVRGQRTWLGWAAVTPLSGGLAFGAIVVQAFAAPVGGLNTTLLAIAIDALLFSRRWRAVVGIPFSEAMLAEPWQVRRTPLLAARFFLLDAVPFLALTVAQAPVAVIAAAAGLAVDRFGFYALALQHTTEHEVAAVEEQIASAGGRASR